MGVEQALLDHIRTPDDKKIILFFNLNFKQYPKNIRVLNIDFYLLLISI